MNGDDIYNGAHDNASGAAIVLEVAKAYAALPATYTFTAADIGPSASISSAGGNHGNFPAVAVLPVPGNGAMLAAEATT